MKKYQFLAETSNFRRQISLHVATVPREDGAYAVAMPVMWVTQQTGDLVPEEPLLKMSQTDGQNLMDELWRCGLRPSEGSGSAGALAATERHLADMQKISFDLLAKVQP